MRRIAAGITLTGFVFAFVTLPFQGVDLLLDPVGFLLVFNGQRAFGKGYGGFKLSQLGALLLMAFSAVQLFVAGGFFVLVSPLRRLVEGLLFLAMQREFGAMLRREGWLWDAGFVRGSLLLASAASLLVGGAMLWRTELSARWGTLLNAGHLLVLLALLRLLLVSDQRIAYPAGEVALPAREPEALPSAAEDKRS